MSMTGDTSIEMNACG